MSKIDLDAKMGFVVLPEGIHNVGDIFDSQAFKDMASEYENRPRKPFEGLKGILNDGERIMVMSSVGEGKSMLTEYLKSLKQYKAREWSDALAKGEFDGRSVMYYEK